MMPVTHPAPVRLVHLGLGSFFRAHQAWYTQHAADGEAWGIAAFSGRRPDLATALRAQEGRYTLVARTADRDRFEVIDRISRAHLASDQDAWLAYLAAPEVAAVTVTVTEAGYVRGPNGGCDHSHVGLRVDVEALRRDLGAPVSTAPARLVAGLAARRAADSGPIAVVPCDNLPDNGALTAGVVRDLADLVDPTLGAWIDASTTYVTTTVDRITPATTDEDRRTVAAGTGWADRAPVVTEPFSEWVLSGEFANGRPRWESAGATFTDDVGPFEQRKLWLLNGAHSLLAYAGSIRGRESVADAVADEVCRGWLEQWWDEACPHLPLPAAELASYRDALLVRFANPRMQHRLDQIAADGSQKLVVRVLPTLRLERAAGRLPAAATRTLAAWLVHLRDQRDRVTDVRADELISLAVGTLPSAARRVLACLDPDMAEDDDVVAAVVDHAGALAVA